MRLSDDWATLHRKLDKLDSLANHPDVVGRNASVYPLVPNENEHAYSVDTDPYQQSSPPGSMGYYPTPDGLQPMNRQDQRHASVQYSVVSEVDATEQARGGSYFPQAGPVSPDDRAHPNYGRYQQQY